MTVIADITPYPQYLLLRRLTSTIAKRYASNVNREHKFVVKVITHGIRNTQHDTHCTTDVTKKESVGVQTVHTVHKYQSIAFGRGR